ncbi:MAG: DUF4349 domain-containing protein, partial [Caldilineaceae bacterium]|nr:DUF4349 domain-containing protein [Caldilineaceae bacterium]
RVWEKALQASDRASSIAPNSARKSLWERPIKSPWAAAAATVLVCALIGFMMLPSLGKARHAATFVEAEPHRLADLRDLAADTERSMGQTLSELRAPVVAGVRVDRNWAAEFAENMAANQQFAELASKIQQEAARLVERKATMEVEVADTRTAYIKAQALISEARGEFVQGGRIDEQDGRPRADLTLRVQAERMDQVLNDLRSLGIVKDERLDAADVTDQMVDIEARLANERRIEAELLALLDKRPDDKLEDILRVRKELSAVREQIERMQASRAKLASLVALATVTVVITQEPEEPAAAPAEQGLWGAFVEDIGHAWRDGVENLLGLVVWLTGVVISALPVWLLSAVAAVWAWRAYLRAHPRPLPV